MPLPPQVTLTLDRLMLFLASTALLSLPKHHADRPVQEALCVLGSWYDVPHKAEPLSKAAISNPEALLLLVGGRAERLTPLEAEAVGGEPLLLLRTLASEFGVPLRRPIVYTGSRVTTHNLKMLLHYAKQHREFSGAEIGLRIFEERYLVRRAAATLSRLLRGDAEARAAVAWVAFEPVGDARFHGLVRTHRGHAEVALALVVGEYERLARYDRAGNGSTATHGKVSRGAILSASEALAGLGASLRAAVEAMRAQLAHGALAEGARVLTQLPHEQMQQLASPLTEPGGKTRQASGRNWSRGRKPRRPQRHQVRGA